MRGSQSLTTKRPTGRSRLLPAPVVVVAADSVPAPLFRVARPRPLAFPSWEFVGGGRFDDPSRHVRTLYAAEHLTAAFIETLARFRRPVALTAHPAVASVTTPVAGLIPAGWLRSRLIVRLRLEGGQSWLDVRVGATQQLLRTELAWRLRELGLDDLDASDVMSRNRDVTQSIARWTLAHHYQGIVYRSRLDSSFTCWAIFEGARFAPVAAAEPISPDSPDLLRAAEILRLQLAPDWETQFEQRRRAQASGPAGIATVERPRPMVLRLVPNAPGSVPTLEGRIIAGPEDRRSGTRRVGMWSAWAGIGRMCFGGGEKATSSRAGTEFR